MLGADDDRLLFWDKFLELGRDYRRQHPDAVDRMASARDDDVMTLVYTSGTTGPPKGAMLTNRNCAFCVDKLVNSKGRVPGGPPTPDDQILTYLPLCHVAERIFSTWTAVSTRCGAQLRRVDRDRQREPARGAADVVLRRATHLGEAARGVVDQSQRRLLVQEAHAAVRRAPGESHRADQGRPRWRAHLCSRGFLPPSAGCWCSARCGNGSGCVAAAMPSPARRRSRPRYSSSSSGSASRSTSSTA